MKFASTSTLIIVYAGWVFTSIKNVEWGWAGIVWLYKTYKLNPTTTGNITV
jgi:type IV secretory pathway TrbL component